MVITVRYLGFWVMLVPMSSRKSFRKHAVENPLQVGVTEYSRSRNRAAGKCLTLLTSVLDERGRERIGGNCCIDSGG